MRAQPLQIGRGCEICEIFVIAKLFAVQHGVYVM